MFVIWGAILMKIFVTGATGFVGGHFVERALANGHQIVGIHNSSGPQKRAFVDHLRSLGAELHQGNILDTGSFAAHLSDVDVVCHFAAAFRENGVNDEYFRRANVDGTSNVVKAAASAGVRRFVLCSTTGIYGHRMSAVIDERMPPRPWNIYEATKLAAENELRRLAVEFGMEYVILRPTAVYGPRDERLLKLFRSAAKGRFPLFGQGDGRRHMVYVTDLADAFLRANVQPQAASEELIIGGPEAVPLRELLATLANVLGRKSCGPKLPLKPMLAMAAMTEDVCKVLKVSPPIYRRRMDFYLNDAEFSSVRAREVLNWQPAVDLRDGLARTLAAYRDQGQMPNGRSLAAGFVSPIAGLMGGNEFWSAASAYLV
jgi:nucleoside-diphosphate-sugar epimerase